MIIIYSILFALVLWGVVKLLIVYVLVRDMRKARAKEWVNVLIDFLKRRSERRLLYFFITTEAGLAGVVPQILKSQLTVKKGDTEFGLWLEVCQNSEWLSCTIAIIIAIAYFFFLWQSNKKSPQQIKEIIDAARLIDEEYNFSPTHTWFEKQNIKAIKSLGKRFSKERNFPFENMEFALASLREKDDFRILLEDKILSFEETTNDFISKIKDKEEYNVLYDKFTHVVKLIDGLDGKVSSYKHLREEIEDALHLNDFDAFYYQSSKYQISSNLLYSGRNVREKAEELSSALENEWIAFKEYHAILITGDAGTGKSHLIGDMVTRRKSNNEPSILLLGQHFTIASDPLSQIREMIDVKCKKERLLQQLDEYGKRNDVTTAIFIDAINEGAGEDLWKSFLTDLITEFAQFQHLRLVISFRTSQRRNWFYEIAHDTNYPVYSHQGFKGHEREACEYIFSSFGLDQPLWPVYGKEFSNPLFLIKYCRNHERSKRPLEFEDFWVIIKEYCKATNHELAIKFKYNDAIDLVTDSLRAIAELMIVAGSRWHLEYEKVITKLTDVAKYINQSKEFFEILIDEGLLRTERYNGQTYVSYGFERIGDYFIAEYLVNNVSSDKWFDYKWGDLSEAMSVIVPAIKDTELIDLVQDKYEAIQCFIDNAAWRDSFNDKGHRIIYYLKESKEYEALINMILSRPSRSDESLNGKTLYDLLWNLSMSERDAIWTVNISNDWNNGKILLDLAQWGSEASAETICSLRTYTAQLCAETLVWSFSTTYRQLRDTATHAVVNILKTHNVLIIPLLQKFHGVNDPYIEERLWCSVYGALLLSQDSTLISCVAEWTYNNVFLADKVPEHILTRNYTRNIVVYGNIAGRLSFAIDKKKINAPFTDGKLPHIYSWKEIKRKYERNWDSVPENERDEYGAQYALLSSMATEGSRRMTYGDFGRYVFQAHISDFGEDAELMSNWGIQMIFEEFNYSPKVFAEFDNHNSSRSRAHSRVERIGKKYQWIALYRIMARLMDRYPDKDWNDKWATPTQMARTIDPTVFSAKKATGNTSVYKVPSYPVYKPKDDFKWLKNWREMPKMKEYLIVTDEKGREWINLFSYNSIIHKPHKKDSLKRDLWTFIQAYSVNKRDLKTVCRKIHKYGIRGRSFHENGDLYGIFSREFFWSDDYKENVREGYSYHVPFSIDNHEFADILIEPTYLQYRLSADYDASCEDGMAMLLPNGWIYEGLNLRYANENGAWCNEAGEILVFDNSVYANGHSALLIRKDVMLEYLNKNNMCLFWPVLNERMIQTEGMGYAKHVQCGGWAYMDEDGKIHQFLKSYEPTEFEKRCKSYKQKLAKYSDSTLLWLHQHHIIWLPKNKKMKLYLGDDYNWRKSLDINIESGSLEEWFASLEDSSSGSGGPKI